MYGKNEVAGPRSAAEGFLVKNIWHTIQGEGPYAGLPAVFVRFAGCNLRCTFCDTDFSGGEQMDAAGLRALILNAKAGFPRTSLVVLTGGEPMLQPIHLLMQAMEEDAAEDRYGGLDTPYRFQIETAGTAWPQDEGDPRDFDYFLAQETAIVICSPKTPSINKKVAQAAEAFKYIIRAGEVAEDGLPHGNTQPGGFRFVRIYRPAEFDENGAEIYVQPCDEGNLRFGIGEPSDRAYSPGATVYSPSTSANVKAAVESALKFGYTLSMQLHKIVGVD